MTQNKSYGNIINTYKAELGEYRENGMYLPSNLAEKEEQLDNDLKALKEALKASFMVFKGAHPKLGNMEL